MTYRTLVRHMCFSSKRKVCARWNMYLLTSDKKKTRVEKTLVLLTRFKDRDARSLRQLSQRMNFEPNNKLTNRMWLGENSNCPVVVRRNRSVKRAMYALCLTVKE
jgi:hypothetical protein